MKVELVYRKREECEHENKHLLRTGEFESVRAAKNGSVLLTLANVYDKHDAEPIPYKSFKLEEVHNLRINGIKVDAETLADLVADCGHCEPILDISQLL